MGYHFYGSLFLAHSSWHIFYYRIKKSPLGAEGYMYMGNLAALKQYDKIKKQSLYKSEPFEVMVLTVAKGEFLKPHTSKTDAFLVVIEGDLIFTLEGKILYCITTTCFILRQINCIL
jgi:hypothetical protein